MDFAEVVRARRMTRSFSSEPVHSETIDHAVDLAT
ncbi:MAG: nitroreductase family protein, partial [Actinobacteria bacterium]|nr:nitroreductase family protein [Actinomycetota bacterium]